MSKWAPAGAASAPTGGVGGTANGDLIRIDSSKDKSELPAAAVAAAAAAAAIQNQLTQQKRGMSESHEGVPVKKNREA